MTSHKEKTMNIDTEEGMLQAMQWTQDNIVDRLSRNGRWAIPRSNTMCTLDKDTRTVHMECVHGQEESVERVFLAMGWTVTKKAPPFSLNNPVSNA